MIAIAGQDNTVRFRAAATGETIGPPLVHASKVGAIAFSPDGRTLLTGCDDTVARLWDVTTGAAKTTEFRHKNAVLGVAFQPGWPGCLDRQRRPFGPALERHHRGSRSGGR